SAASIWGVRAGNGVVVINMKKGRSGMPLEIEINSNLTIGEKPNIFYRPSISTTSFIEMEKQLFLTNFYRSDEPNSLFLHPLSPVVELLIAHRDGLLSSPELNEHIDEFSEIDVRTDFDEFFLQRSI